jgi:hypothetical protein
MKRTIAWVAIAGLAISQIGCLTTESGRGAAIGTGLGAGMGAVLGNNWGHSRNDRELGIAAGAILGGLIGHAYGTQKETQAQLNAVQAGQQMETVWITNSNGSRTPVLLRKAEGGQYVGPRGEYYSSRPTEQQLRAAYGM